MNNKRSTTNELCRISVVRLVAVDKRRLAHMFTGMKLDNKAQLSKERHSIQSDRR